MAEKVGVLIVEAGVDPGREFVIKDGQTFHVGRDKSNEYSVPFATNLSRVHCRIENRAGSLSVTDLDSKNGTLVNGKKIKSIALRENDRIQAGGVRFRVCIRSDEPAKKPADAEAPVIRVRREATEKTPVPPKTPINVAAARQHFSKQALSLAGQAVGSYRIMNAVAASRRGLVYKAVEPAKNRLVAIKILSQALASSPEGVRWFTQGAKRAGAVQHENVVPVLGGGRLGPDYYLVTLFMGRGSAQARFRQAEKEGVKSVKAALQAAIQVTRALEYGLQKNLLHRGVRPTKVLFDEKKRVRLNGLGFDNGPGPGFDLESAAARYLAPEQVQGGPVDFRADVYGLGGTFYYMLTGHAPQRDNRGVLRSPRSLNRLVPESLCRIVEKMLDRDPAKRYEGYAQLLHDLRWALRGEVWPAGR